MVIIYLTPLLMIAKILCQLNQGDSMKSTISAYEFLKWFPDEKSARLYLSNVAGMIRHIVRIAAL